MENKKLGIITLKTPKKCEYTGKLYNQIVRTKCNCPCHSNTSVLHIVECCENGYIETPILK